MPSSPAHRDQHLLYEEHDRRTLDVASQDLITVQFPVSATQLPHLSKGWTDAGAAIYDSITFTLERENCSVAGPYLDNG